MIFLVCLSLFVYSADSSRSCRWVDHKFRQYSEDSLNLLEMMAPNSTDSNGDAEGGDAVAFPNKLYDHASNASAEDKLAFAVKVLNMTAALFEEDQSSASWEENAMENFVNVVTRQADELRSCIRRQKKNMKLQMYFERLSRQVLENMGHSAEAWELIRKEVKSHLMRVDHLVSPLIRSDSRRMASLN